jgi:CDP-diacylglycerol--glycerol-3-phosphate 3-phosphatidyltransferase
MMCAVPLAKIHRTFPAAAADYFFSSLPRSAISAILINALPFNREAKGAESLAICTKLLENKGNILIIFPEGTRTTSGEMGRFRSGIGRLVAGTDLAVLPCYLEGGLRAWPKGKLLPRPYKLRLRIGTAQTYGHLEKSGQLKPAFQNLLRPLCNTLARAGVTANQVTVAAMLLSFVVGMLLVHLRHLQWILFLVPVALFVRMALNAIDGMLAREHNMQSPLGGILNELGDVISDTVLYAPFAVFAGISPHAVGAVVLLAVLSEMTGVVAVQIGARRRYDGPMGKSDRAFVFGLLAVILGFGVDPGWWVNAALTVVAILIGMTIVNRARNALRELDESG